jgi:hypothetical protein
VTPLLIGRWSGQNFERRTQILTARDVWSSRRCPVQISTWSNCPGADFSPGSGNVVYQVDGATITDNTYGNPLGRQNGGTNTFFDFSTFDDVEVATGGSVVEQQNSGVTINVVTKRGTNQLKGSARFLYASANWQSDNTSQEAIDQGWEYNDTRFIREYGLELGGPILRDKLWIWGAGSRQDISLSSFNYDQRRRRFRTTTRRWAPSRTPDLELELGHFSRSNRIGGRCGGASCTAARPPETRTELLIPTNFYKIEDSNVFSADLFASIYANYQDVDYTSNPSGGLAPQCAPPFDVAPTGCAQIDFYGNDDGSDGAWHNTWNYFYAKDPQKQANLSVSKFFNTGSINHELKASFNYRTQTADSASGIPGDQLQGYEYSYSSATALISRGVRTIYKTQYLSGTLGDTLTAGNLTVNAGVRYDLQQGKNLPSRSFGNQIFPELLPTVEFHGTEDWQFEYTNWQPRLSATYALGEKKNTLLRGSYAQFADQLGYIVYYGNGTPISNGYYYYWSDSNRDLVRRTSLFGTASTASVSTEFLPGSGPAQPVQEP